MPLNYIGTVLPPFIGFTAFTPEVPKLYWDVKSQEQRIFELFKQFHKLVCYANAISEEVNGLSTEIEQILEDFKTQVEEQLAAQDTKITEQLAAQDAKVTQQLQEMKDYIDIKFDEYAQGMLMWDVTTGRYRPSVESTRRLFQALSFDHVGERQLVSYCAANYAVADMAVRTVYNVAYSDRETVTIDDQIMTN